MESSDNKINVRVRTAQTEDVRAVCDIYNYYVKSSRVTFQEIPQAEDKVLERIEDSDPGHPCLVAELNGRVVGYVYAGSWKKRSAYRYAVELGIYVENGLTGKGIGPQLLKNIIDRLKHTEIHCLIAGITLPNPPSIRLFEGQGFKKVGEFREVGYKFDEWINVGYWQKLI